MSRFGGIPIESEDTQNRPQSRFGGVPVESAPTSRFGGEPVQETPNPTSRFGGVPAANGEASRSKFGGVAVEQPTADSTFGASSGPSFSNVGGFLSEIPAAIGTGLRRAKGSLEQIGHHVIGHSLRAFGPRTLQDEASEFLESSRTAPAKAQQTARNDYGELSTGGEVVSGLTQFGAGYALTGGAGGLARAGTQAAARYGAPLVSGAVADAVAFSPSDPTIGTVIEEGIGVPIPTAQQKDDAFLTGRLKHVAEGGALGLGLDAAARGVGRLARGADEAAPAAKPRAEQPPSPVVRPPDEESALASGLPVNAEMAQRAGQAATDQAKETGGFLRREFGSMIGRVESYGTPAARETAQRAKRAVDVEGAARGQLNEPLNRVLRLAGSPSGVTRRGRAISELSRPQRVEGKNYGMAPLRQAIEGKIDPPTSEAAEAIEAARALIDKRGELFERVGLKQMDPDTGDVVSFQRKGDKVAPRVMTPEFFDLVERGQNSKSYQAMVDAFADTSGASREQVESIFENMRGDMLEEGPQATAARSQAEFMRQFPEIPDVLYVNNRAIPLTETSLYDYARTLADRGAARIGVVRAFGQDIGDEAPVAALRQRFADEGGKPEAFTQLMRGLHRLNPERPIVDPGSQTAQLIRGVNSAMGVVKESILSLSAVPNLAEPLGAAREFTGNMNMLKGAFDLVRRPRETIQALEQAGAITKAVANLSIDPNRPAESFAKGVRELMSRATLRNPVEELGEKLTAAGTARKVQRMQQGRGGTADILDLRSLGYSLEDARRLAQGGGTQAEYDAIVREAPRKLMGSNLSRAEQSRFENRRVVKALVAFQHYAQTTIRRTANMAKTYVRTMNDAITGSNLKGAERWNMAFRANTKLANHLFGRAAAGATSYFLLSALVGGTDGAKIAWNEAKSDPVKFLKDSLIYSLFAGPFGAVIRTFEGDINDTGDFLGQSVFPFHVAKQAWDYASGSGMYEGRNWGDATSQLLQRMAPVSKVFNEGILAQGMAAMGFGNEKARQLDVAHRAYWRWRFEAAPPPDFTPGQVSESQKRFRRHMGSAYDTLRSGGTPQQIAEHLLKALQTEGKEGANLAASIRARKLLTRRQIAPGESDEVYQQRLRELVNRIGKDAYRNLLVHDRLLEAWAESLN